MQPGLQASGSSSGGSCGGWGGCTDGCTVDGCNDGCTVDGCVVGAVVLDVINILPALMLFLSAEDADLVRM